MKSLSVIGVLGKGQGLQLLGNGSTSLGLRRTSEVRPRCGIVFPT